METRNKEAVELEFIRKFGPLTISMGYGRDIQSYAAEQSEKLGVWKAAIKWISKEMKPQAANTVHGECNCRVVEGIHVKDCPANYDYDTTRPRIHNKKMLAEIHQVVIKHSNNEVLADTVVEYISAPSVEPQRPKSADASSSPKDSSPLSLLLDQIEQRANKATPGPWTHNSLARLPEDYYLEDLILGGDNQIIGAPISAPNRREYTEAAGNLNFIASSRTDVPALVKALRELWNDYQTLAYAKSEAMVAQARVNLKEQSLTAILTQAK